MIYQVVMHIVIFAHPDFLGSQSMPRYAQWLKNGMESLGHTVEIWRPSPRFYKLPFPAAFKKWLGYIDQYLIFPGKVKRRMKSYSIDTVYVFADNALGPWVPLAAGKHHVIHCHDFLAQQSALRQIKENPTSWTGKQYQAYIRNGFRQGRNFIAVSQHTQKQLHDFLTQPPLISEVVYNALTQHFEPIEPTVALNWIQDQTRLPLPQGYILHVGGNQWYKNRQGVIEIYDTWRKQYASPLPLLLVGPPPADCLKNARERSAFKEDIHFISGKSDEFIRKVYSGASVLLFPSLAEGFGWPIAEAMACGCPVITTNAAPMTEVAGGAAFLIERRAPDTDKSLWLKEAAATLQHVLQLNEEDKQQVQLAGLKNIERFNSRRTILKIESIYKRILNEPAS